MNCKCGGKTDVLDTRASIEGNESFARRRRACLLCGARFSTIEVVIEGTYTAGKRVMKPNKPKELRKKMDAEQVRRNAQARRMLEEVRDGEYGDEIDAVLRGRNLDDGLDND